MADAFELTMGARLVGYPAAAALAGVVLARILPESSRGRTVALTAGVVGGALVTHIGIAGKPPLPPIDTIGWLPLAALALGLWGVLMALADPTRRLARMAGGLVGLGVLAASWWLTGKPTFQRTLPLYYPIAGVGLGAVGLAWVRTQATAVAVHRVVPWASLTLVLLGAAGAAQFSASAKLAMLLASFGVTTGIMALATLLTRVPTLSAWPLLTAYGYASCAIVYAHLYGKLSAPLGLMLAGAVVVPLAVATLPLRRGKLVVALVLSLLLAGGAAGLAYRAQTHQPANMYG